MMRSGIHVFFNGASMWCQAAPSHSGLLAEGKEQSTAVQFWIRSSYRYLTKVACWGEVLSRRVRWSLLNKGKNWRVGKGIDISMSNKFRQRGSLFVSLSCGRDSKTSKDWKGAFHVGEPNQIEKSEWVYQKIVALESVVLVIMRILTNTRLESENVKFPYMISKFVV